jgi:hypothetical protein
VISELRLFNLHLRQLYQDLIAPSNALGQVRRRDTVHLWRNNREISMNIVWIACQHGPVPRFFGVLPRQIGGFAMRIALVFLLSILIARPCDAWWEGGHHLIAVMAYELLSEGEQHELQTILAAHPRIAEDFMPPMNVSGPEETNLWRIGRAAYWPDVARSQPKFTRPNWHYQLGATLTVGENVNVPKTPGAVPESATLDTENLHIAQAVELCRTVLRDKTRPLSDRALAICWLAHLVGDAHQPCHAGSLYFAGLFPEGDRGANFIPTKQSDNLHFLWDGLLGAQFDAGDVRRRARTIASESQLWGDATRAAQKEGGLNPLTWLAESGEFGRSHVYAPEILTAVESAARESRRLEMIDLSESYLKAAGEAARIRAAFAAHRLAAVLREGL